MQCVSSSLLRAVHGVASRFIPLIAAAVGGVPEILNDPGVGWLIPSSDENELFSAMRAAMNLDQEILRQKGTKAREHVVRHFNAIDRWIGLVTVVEAAFRDAGHKPRARQAPT